MKITFQLNGEPHQIEAGAGLAELLQSLNLRSRERLAVEINERVIPKADYAQTVLREGDRVEIIHFVGGG
ncbi:MAG TPA: sulfur carrier protein ThiS [Candidatus Binataceae bacterium]|nr:sulfur carrier protein ThiS [Candidatus Binataceae bacterium]